MPPPPSPDKQAKKSETFKRTLRSEDDVEGSEEQNKDAKKEPIEVYPN